MSFPKCSALRSSSEGSSKQRTSDAHSSIVASLSMVFGLDVSPGRLSVRDSNPEGPSVSGSRDNHSPPTGDLETVVF